MRLTNVHIENFRNIVRADVDFGPINIITGKNSSGKSNLLLALSNILKTDRDFASEFLDNVVTFGKGKHKTVFRTTVSDIKMATIFSGFDQRQIYIAPKTFTFENSISKKTSSSISQKLYYTGEFSEMTKMPNLSIEEIKKTPNFQEISTPSLVYESEFVEDLEMNDGKQIMRLQENGHEHREKFYKFFADSQESLCSFVSSPLEMSTSAQLYKYVVSRHDTEVYDQVLARLRSDDQMGLKITSFSKSKFIFLLADVQRYEPQRKKFADDLHLYTKGVITDVKINLDSGVGNKGEIIVDSPNAPKDIMYVSSGTAMILFFILLKNWAELPIQHQRSYRTPQIMIFDEIDSMIHPSLMCEFVEVIKSISKNIQLFISTHSSHFINCFEKNQLYWLKDFTDDQSKPNNHSNIYSYQSIINKLPKQKDYFEQKENSDLFVDGLLDSIFPNE